METKTTSKENAAESGTSSPPTPEAAVEEQQAPVAEAAAETPSESSDPLLIKSKEERIDELKISSKDVGSTEVQIGLLTDKIRHLTGHLKTHPKDKHTGYGLRKMVSRRKRLLNYLSRRKPESHEKVKAALGMR